MLKPEAEEIYRVLVNSKARKNFTIQDSQELYGRGITDLQVWSKALDLMEYLKRFDKKK